MDFLKTLLLYMSVTMAAAVQEGPLPEDVPTPTIVPTAQVEAQETTDPETTALPGLQVELPDTPTPQPKPTEVPKPTITPNASYKNIEFGDRGKKVENLQKRLIELGYLPEGAADGAFGYQTYQAVKDFQKANGLHSDGVAGRSTQTRLFEDPDVVAAITPTPAATDTPEPEKSTVPEIEEPIAIPEPAALPEAKATEEAAEETAEPTVETTQAPTRAPTQEPTEAPTEGPEYNSVGLAQVKDASIVLGASGTQLVALRLSDGVMMPFYPRVWLNEEGMAAVALRDMADSIGAWTLEVEEGTYTLSAAGYVMVFTVDEDSVTCVVDDEDIELAEGDVLYDGEEIYVTEHFMQQVFKARTVWDDDERTLLLDIPEKAAALAND